MLKLKFLIYPYWNEENSIWGKNLSNFNPEDITVKKPRNFDEQSKLDDDYIVRPCMYRGMTECLVQNDLG